MKVPADRNQALSDHGPFHRTLTGFVPRSSQQEMAAEVERVLVRGGVLVAESGTGTGKTFAYLVPVIEQGVRSIISTGTRHLQDQIFHRDIQSVSKVLGRSVHAALLKGRGNYLCRYRLRQVVSQTTLFEQRDDATLSAIAEWAARTRHGDITEMTGMGEQDPVWRQVTSTNENCLGGKCPDYAECHVMKARQRALTADVVVVNHHLLLSDMMLKEEGVGELLPQCDAVILDEAHKLPSVASDFFGFFVSSFHLEELAEDIKAAEIEERSAADFSAILPALSQAIEDVNSTLRHWQPRVLEHSVLEESDFRKALVHLDVCLDELCQVLTPAAPAGESLENCLERAKSIRGKLNEWVDGQDPNLVCWLAKSHRRFRLHATPLRIDSQFGSLVDTVRSWVFTSATLAVGDDFSAYTSRLGIAGTQKRWGSPYNYRHNALLYLPPAIPDPRAKDFPDRLAELIPDILQRSQGRAFCLFTSYDMMNLVHSKLKDRLSWPLLLQGTAPRSELVDEFRQAGNAVLFGTASFWEGVDVPGEALSCVVIDRLPFAAPSDPVLKRRIEVCREMGGNPFMDIQVPDAIQILKQGAGRLIRSERDRGVLAICDRRVQTMHYGQLFVENLPPMRVSRKLEDVTRFFQ